MFKNREWDFSSPLSFGFMSIAQTGNFQFLATLKSHAITW
jgi:hypothetical protein